MLGEYSDSEGSEIELPSQAGAGDEARPSNTSAASSPSSTPYNNFEKSTVGQIERGDLSTIDTIKVESSSTSAADTMASYAQPAHSASKPGVDAFDSVEWDPDLPSGVSPDKSPEPVPIKPKPVEYTTVGSLVNNKIVPQFTAPNRIQREGAQRKSLMSILHSYETGTLTNQQRGPPPPLNMANSMQYAQQIGRNPTSAPNAPRITVPQSRHPVFPTGQIPTGPTMSDQEKEIFVRTFGPFDLKLENQPTSARLQDHTFNIKELSEAEIEARLSASAGGALQDLDKMATLHNLSKFKNPLQQFAKDRLEAFSAAKMHGNRSAPAVPNIGMLDITNGNRSNTTTISSSHVAGKAASNAIGKVNPSEPKSAPASVFSSFENFYNLNQRAQNSMADPNTRNQGELDRNYEFPPGPPHSTNTQANPLYGAYSASTQPFSNTSVPPGYPKPLTAGPPGQRLFPANLSAQANSSNQQYAGISSSQTASSREQYYGMSSAQGDLANQQYFRNTTAQANPNSQQIPGYLSAQVNATREDVYGSRYGQGAASNFPAPSPWATKKSGFDHGVRTKIVDTISPEDAMKYYPNGLPPNMTGAWAPMSDESKRQMKMLPPLTPQEEKAKQEEELNDQFEYGSRRYHGTYISPFGLCNSHSSFAP